MLNFLFTLTTLCSISTVALAQRQITHVAGASAKKAEVVKARMVEAFGGSEELRKIAFITYTHSGFLYKDGDTVSFRQLWYMHLQEPHVVKLELNGADTTTFSTPWHSLGGNNASPEENPVHAGLLRSRFFNFFYLLTTEEAVFTYVQKRLYNNSQVDILSVTSRADATLSIDLFVNNKGEIVTSSSVSPASGKYVIFADEHTYERVAGKVKFPLQYRVMRQGNVLAEGYFSDIQLNSLSAFWKKQLKTLKDTP